MSKITTGNTEYTSNASLTSHHYKLNSSGIITDDTASRVLSTNDNGRIIYFTSNSAITVTTAASLGVGFSCTLIQAGTGQITVTAGSNTTINSYGGLVKSAGQYAIVGIISPVADAFILGGNLI